MTDFKTMTKKTLTKKKILAGVTTVVALSGFVPAINAASPTATANVGVSVVIQQAITLTAGAPVDFGTIILSNTTVVGTIYMQTSGALVKYNLDGEASLAGGNVKGTMAINSSAGAVNIALGAKPTYDSSNINVRKLRFGGTALATKVSISGTSNANVTLIGGIFDIGGSLVINSKPTPGTYNTKSYTITVSDI